MSSNDAEIFKSWGQTLAQTRASQGRDSGTMSRELMLSLAQIRGIENGDSSAFHAQSYYLRGVQRYAQHLNIELEPSVASLKGPDNPEAQRARTPHRAAGIAKRHHSPADAMALPDGRARVTQTGRWLLLLLVVLGGFGVYMAVQDGWPNRVIDSLQTQHDNGSETQQQESSVLAAAEMLEAAPVAEQALVTKIDPITPPKNSVTATPTAPNSTTTPTPSALPTTSLTGAPEATLASASTPEHSAQNVSNPAPVAPAVDSVNDSSPESVSVVPPISNQDIVLSFSEECWVEWRLNDGQTQQRIYKPGEQLRLPVDQVQRLVLGNARAIQAQAFGKPLDLLQFVRGSGSVARIEGAALVQTIR